MDDPVATVNAIRQNYARWSAAIDRIQPPPQNTARRERLEHLEGLINNQLMFTRADTQGNVDARPIKQLVLEQAMLESEIERDQQDYARQVQEAIGQLGDVLNPIFSQSTPTPSASLRIGHARGSTIPTPTRTSPSNPDDHHGSDRSEGWGPVGDGLILGDGDDDHTRQDRGSGADHHDTSHTHPQPRATNDEAPPPTAQQHGRSRLRRTSTAPATATSSRQAKRPRRDKAPTTQAPSVPKAISKKTRRQKKKPYQWVAPTSYRDIKPEVANPKPGDIFACWWPERSRKVFFPVMILPWGYFKRFDFKAALQHTDLNKEVPACYAGAREDDVTQRPWAEGYEDGGPLAHRRMFPVLFFNKVNFPIKCAVAWVPLHDLKEFDENCPHTIRKDLVEEYLECKASHEKEGAEKAARMASRPSGHSNARETIEGDRSQEARPVAAAGRTWEEDDSEKDESFDSDLPGENVQSHGMGRMAWASSSEVDDPYSYQS